MKLPMRFEGLPGEFSQHDFGQVKVRFFDGSCHKVHFFASRLKWSRWVEVTLVRARSWRHWRRDWEISIWNPTFAYAALELGFTAEVRWTEPRGALSPSSPRLLANSL